MRITQKRVLMFGDLIMAERRVRGAGQAEDMVRLAINTRLVAFQEPPHFSISSAKGRSA
jgi:hypothetical protein